MFKFQVNLRFHHPIQFLLSYCHSCHLSIVRMLGNSWVLVFCSYIWDYYSLWNSYSGSFSGVLRVQGYCPTWLLLGCYLGTSIPIRWPPYHQPCPPTTSPRNRNSDREISWRSQAVAVSLSGVTKLLASLTFLQRIVYLKSRRLSPGFALNNAIMNLL